MSDLITFVPCARPAYIAEPVYDEGDFKEISLTPIVAWRIEYDATYSVGTPVTIESFNEFYVIYFSDTKEWSVPEERSGTGLDELLEYFNSNSRYKI